MARGVLRFARSLGMLARGYCSGRVGKVSPRMVGAAERARTRWRTRHSTLCGATRTRYDDISCSSSLVMVARDPHICNILYNNS